jgi:hypothetical protein
MCDSQQQQLAPSRLAWWCKPTMCLVLDTNSTPYQKSIICDHLEGRVHASEDAKATCQAGVMKRCAAYDSL